MEAKCILIVEDDEIVRKSLTNFAKKRNLASQVAATDQEAIEKVQANPGKFCCILIDFYLDENDQSNNAFKLSQTLQQISGNNLGKLVVMSGGNISYYNYFYIDDKSKAEYEPYGFTYFLKKPVGRKAFDKAMEQLGI